MGRADVTPGSTVGTYDVQGKLGATAWSDTFVAASSGGEKLVALKVFDKEDVDDATWEIVAAAKAKLESVPNHLVLAMVDVGVDEETGVRFVATTLSDHPSLADLVEIYALAPAEAVALVKNLAIAVDAAHAAGLSHRALKPANVFVGPPPTYAVRIVDFGAEDLRRAKNERGALAWLAPEQLDEGASADGRADVFAVALLAFFAMTGKTYWSASSEDEDKLLAEIRAPRVKPSVRARAAGASFPTKLDDVLVKALGPADQRFESARAFADTLEAALAEPPPKEEEQRSSERHIKATLRLEKFRMPTLENTAPSGMQEAAPPVADMANVTKTQKLAPLRLPTPERPPLPPPAPPPRRSSPSIPDATPSTPPPSPRPLPPEPPTDPASTTSAPIATPIETAPTRRPRTVYIPNRVLAVLVVGVTALTLGVTIAAFRKINSTPPPAASAVAPAESAETPGPPTSIVVPPPPEDDAAPDASALGPNESELEVVCTPSCEKVLIDGKNMPQYPAPLRLTPGRHGVGVARTGYGGQYKLVLLKPAEKQTVTFTLNELRKK